MISSFAERRGQPGDRRDADRGCGRVEDDLHAVSVRRQVQTMKTDHIATPPKMNGAIGTPRR